MLDDGRILDSARLPQGAIEGHPVTVSAESVMQSIQSAPGSAQGHPITFSGGSIMDSLASVQSQHPSTAQTSAQQTGLLVGSIPVESQTAQRTQEHRTVQEGPLQYHPVLVTDPEQLSDEALQGQ